AFQVQTSGGAQILTVDTTNTGLYINGDVLQTGNGVNALGDQESMVPNSGFEVNNDGTATVADNWTFAQTVATATPSVTTTSPGQGDRSQQMAMSGTTAEGDFTSACVPISATQAYTLSLRFKGTAASTTALDTFLDTYTSKANCVSKTSVTTVNGSVGVAATNAWAAVSTALGNTGLTATWGRVRVRLGSAGTATNLFIDGVRLTPSAVTSGIDVAENYPAQASDNLVPGELVSFGDTAPNGEAYAVRSASKYDGKLFGVVSTQPGLVLDDGKGYEHVTVALAGRVPVRVSDENGAINIGDPITASSVPGVGMKATEPGQIIGYAMQSFSGDGQTGIIVKVQPGFWAPTSGQVLQSTAAQFGSLQISGIANIASLNVTGPATLASLTVTGDVTVHGKLTASIITVTDRLFVNGHLLSEGVKPNIAKDSNLGNDGQVLGANITIDGTDTAGTITLTAGTSAHSGVLATVSFNKPYEQAPRVVLSPTSADSLGLPVFIQKTDNGFQIVTTGTPQAGKNYQFDYVVIGSSSVAQN
ncbi:MAG TPA: hypothetical protein VLF87_02070, partial [Patescibacteria group bacterium]|nr:hypothetical protein [Patescibacteria group bacterium]